MRPAWRGAIAGSALLVVACGTSGVRDADTISAGNPVLLRPASLEGSLSLSQLVTGTYDNKTYKMRFEIEVSKGFLVVVALSEFGVTLFKIVQTDLDIDLKKETPQSMPFDPRYLLADIYLVQGPTAAVERAYAERGLHFESMPKKKLRRVRNMAGDIMAEVHYPASSERLETVVRHYDYPYTLHILTLTHRESR